MLELERVVEPDEAEAVEVELPFLRCQRPIAGRFPSLHCYRKVAKRCHLPGRNSNHQHKDDDRWDTFSFHCTVNESRADSSLDRGDLLSGQRCLLETDRETAFYRSFPAANKLVAWFTEL